jgi:hypothetical protein
MNKPSFLILSCLALHSVIFAAQKPDLSVKREGNVVQFNHTGDVVSFSSNFSPQAIAELKKQGYKGVAKLPKSSFEKFIQEQNYISVLKNIWTEENLDEAISTLEPYAKEGHPMMMLELSRTLCRKMAGEKTFPEDQLKTAFKWYSLGLLTTDLDIECNDDKSTQGAYGMLRQVYHPSHFVPQDIILKTLPPVFRQAVKDYQLHANAPSPEWVLPHGLAAMRGENKLLPKSQWKEIRAKRLQYHLKMIAEAESKQNSSNPSKG